MQSGDPRPGKVRSDLIVPQSQKAKCRNTRFNQFNRRVEKKMSGGENPLLCFLTAGGESGKAPQAWGDVVRIRRWEGIPGSMVLVQVRFLPRRQRVRDTRSVWISLKDHGYPPDVTESCDEEQPSPGW